MKALILITLLLLGCGQPGMDTEKWQARGAEVLQPFKADLRETLMKGMADGPEVAIHSCRLRAPGIAARARSPGMRVGRTSHKLRNPKNVLRQWMRPLLDGYLAEPENQVAQVVQFKNDGVGYVEPIYMKPMCLVCHGEEISQSVQARIAERYPDDKAVDFRVGDFRGLFWVKFSTEYVSERGR